MKTPTHLLSVSATGVSWDAPEILDPVQDTFILAAKELTVLLLTDHAFFRRHFRAFFVSLGFYMLLISISVMFPELYMQGCLVDVSAEINTPQSVVFCILTNCRFLKCSPFAEQRSFFNEG